jgi:hypothetical protein
MEHQQPAEQDRPMPPVTRQAWNLARSLADFIMDGCKTVSQEQYRQRLEICDVCEHRRENRCTKCGCWLSLKACGRAFQCPLQKWPEAAPAAWSLPGKPAPTEEPQSR